MTTISAILFDKDGTLFDYHKTWANWSRDFLIALSDSDMRLARRLALAVDFDLDSVAFRPDSVLVGENPHDIARALLPVLPGASIAGIVTRISMLSADVARAEATPLIPLMLELSSRGLKLGVVTNDTEVLARSHLRTSGVHDLFDYVLGCDSGFSPKPSPDMLLAFSEMTGITPEDIAMVGDSAQDMSAARDAGMVSVAVLTGVEQHSQLAQMADLVLPSIAGLPRWLDAEKPAETAA